jgi:predicted glycoside hydrolase/deacetylase ChbG (UPF0249 family)
MTMDDGRWTMDDRPRSMVHRPPAVAPHADDLGLHESVDRAIFRAFEAGAIAGASILATGPTFATAAAGARAVGLPLALHLALVDTAPLSPPDEIPSLVGSDGRFPPYYHRVALNTQLGRLRPDELRREIRRQLEAFTDADLVGPSGLLLDGHQHLHLLPAVLDALLEIGPEFRLAALRLPLRSPHERRRISPRSLAFALLELLGRRALRRAAALGIATIPCWGVVYAGHLTLPRARAVLASLPPGASGQLLAHPGDDDQTLAAVRPWGYAWETELATVLALAPVATSP